jgi:magnesium-transporting ATPase (P-type)
MGQAPTATHGLPVHEAVVLMGSDRERGLDPAEAERRLAELGPNELPHEAGPSTLTRLVRQLRHPLIYILLAAAAISLLVGEEVDASVILAVVVFNTIVGFVQESRAQTALDALARMVQARATVVRGGRRLDVPSAAVVPGDLVSLASGDAVAADLRLLATHDLRVDESALTGESLPVRKGDAVLPADTVVADRLNMAYAGTLVTHGEGRGIAVGTGAQTELGVVHRLMRETAKLETPLTRKIASFSRVVMWAILALAALTYLLGLARGQDPEELLVAVVALAVGAIPEGLPAAITITLAIGVSQMARRRAIVRRLPAVETLGSTTVICTDKTGTLTENQMTVQAVVAGDAELSVTGVGYGEAGEMLPPDAAGSPTVRECLAAGALCNDAELRRRDGRVAVVGDPTEGALLVSARKAGIDRELLLAERPRVATLPFSSERRLMATLHDGGDSEVVYVKGAAERVLALCATAATDDGPAAIDRDRIADEVHALGARGLRVLAIARGTGRGAFDALARDEPDGELELLGLQAMLDPPRPAAIAAVETCRAAGIDVKMITGDHAATARAIAERIGIEPDSVYARVSPERKLRLVEELQANGEVVAMTGDGVNDAPALRRADIGVAMGRGGTEVARDAADVVLTDDDFATIEAAVEEGRRVFDNIVKFIAWTIPTNVAEGLLVVIAIAAGTTLPILPVQILWINMTTAGALGVMLAFEHGEPGNMSRPPRRPSRPILTRELVGRIALVSALLIAGAFGLFEWALARGMSDAEARTVAVNVFVAGELFYLFNCRSLYRSVATMGFFSNRWLLAGVAAAIALQMLFTYTPAMNSLFDSAPIGWDAWWRILAFGAAVSAAVGLEKRLRRPASA